MMFKSVFARFGFRTQKDQDPDRFEVALKRLQQSQPRQARFRQLFRNRATRLAA